MEFGSPTDQAGFTSLWGRLYAPDAVLLERRVNEIAHSVCEQDPRTTRERRADALIALAAGHDELACACADSDFAAARREATPPVTAVVHVVAHAETLAGVNQVSVQRSAGIRDRWRHHARPAAVQRCWSGPPCARSAIPAMHHPNGAMCPHRRWWSSCAAAT